MPKGSGRAGQAGRDKAARDAADRSKDDRGGIRDRDIGQGVADRVSGKSNQRSDPAATRAKQADLQSFGATPASAEPSRAEAAALGRAIDEMNGGGGFFSDILGIRQQVDINPKTGSWDVRSFKEVNPVETALGLVASSALGPLGGPAVSTALSAFGFEDPLGFEIDLGFGGDPAQEKKGKESQRDGERQIASKTDASAAEAAGLKTKEESAIDKAVKEILEGQKKFTFFDMPMFKALDPEFGKANKEVNLVELLMQQNDLAPKETV